MKYIPLLVLISAMLMLSCSDMDEDIALDPDIGIAISVDTLSFDTLLAGRKSFTQRARLFNLQNKSITVEKLSLRRGELSDFRIAINGQFDYTHDDIIIDSGDSLLLLIDVTPSANPEILLSPINDEIEWIDPVSGSLQKIVLESWAITAEQKNKGIICDENWSAYSAHVITDTLVVDTNCSLVIEEGAKVLFDPGAALFVLGAIHIDGSADDPVLLRGTRMDGNYKQAPGLWNGIYFLEGSKENTIEHTIIENSQTGIRLGSPDNDTIPDVILKNTIIRHSSQFAVQAYNSDLYAENFLAYDVGITPCFHAIGGSYHYNHATITNFPNQFGSQEPALVLADHLIVNDQTLQDQLFVKIENSILWGGAAETDLLISLVNSDDTKILVRNNIIYTNQEWTGNQVSQSLDFIHFEDAFSFDYRLDSVSPAINGTTDSRLAFDLLNFSRDSIPDIGAYEFQ